MKKIFALILALVMCASVLAGCGSKPSDNTTTTPDSGTQQDTQGSTDVSGEMYDAGNVQALVPDGWKAFASLDVFSDEPDATDPNVVSICKGGETDLDLFSKPYIRFDFYGPDKEMMMDMDSYKEFYENVKDIDPITTGDHTWTGFEATSSDVPLTILWAEEGEYQYQASIFTEASSGSISLSDSDVQAILASVAPSTAE